MLAFDAASWSLRIRRVLPRGWFAEPGSTPILDGVLAGLGYAHAQLSSWIAFSRLQLRLATATDDFLDGLCADFLGTRVYRADGETDVAFRVRIRREILRTRATRAAMTQALVDLTGQVPLIVEPGNTSDCGGYDIGGVGFDAGGAWGDPGLAFQTFITAYRPHVGGIAGVDGFDGSLGGWDTGAFEYVSPDQVSGVSDDDIYGVIEATRPAATVCWVRLTSIPPTGQQDLDDSFILDESQLS